MNDLESIINVDYNPSSDEIFTHLSYTSDLLKNQNIKHWIMYGTLLGCIREKNVISYDYDFDLGILLQSVDSVLKLNEIIQKDGYAFEKGNGTVYNINSNEKQPEYMWRVSIKIKYNDIPVADLYVYYECQDGFLRRYDPSEKILFYPNSTFPKIFIEKLQEKEIRGKLFPTPLYPEILLEHFYGPMWKTAIKALSQNGQNHEDYDFYGNFKYSNLNFLIKNTKELFKINLTPNFTKEEIDYIFPLDQIEWLQENENIKIKTKYSK